MNEEKHMSHIRNIVGAIEDKGYDVFSIGYEENRIRVLVENPGYAGNQAFLEKARDQEGQKKLFPRAALDTTSANGKL